MELRVVMSTPVVRYPDKRVPHHTNFTSVIMRLRQIGSLTRATTNQQRITMTPDNEEAVLRLVEDNPSMSTRSKAQQVSLSQTIVWRILAANQTENFWTTVDRSRWSGSLAC
ncbi:hypothetical protein TNCV_307481 [Trichonephila clavipes]|nr:hypothetical protein TNCV_307481 [Trichonephila clavipes]